MIIYSNDNNLYFYSLSCLTINFDNENVTSKIRVLAAWNNHMG